jgi:hypothetical protein
MASKLHTSGLLPVGHLETRVCAAPDDNDEALWVRVTTSN